MHHALLAHCKIATVVSGTRNFGLGYDLGVEWIPPLADEVNPSHMALQVSFGGDADAVHKIGGRGVKSEGAMSLTTGLADFFGPLEMDEGASLGVSAGATMKLGGGASYKIGTTVIPGTDTPQTFWPPKRCVWGGGSRAGVPGTPTYIPENDPLIALIILNTDMWGF